MNPRMLILVLITLPVPALSADVFAPALSTNPFERPAWMTDAQEIPANAPSATPRRRIDLRATLIAGKKSSANVGGRIIGLGEEIDGYTLVAIAEGVAEFSDGEEIFRVKLLTDKDDEDAD